MGMDPNSPEEIRMAKSIVPEMAEVKYYALGGIRNPAAWLEANRSLKNAAERFEVRCQLQFQLDGKVPSDPTGKGMSPMVPSGYEDAKDDQLVFAGKREDGSYVILPLAKRDDQKTVTLLTGQKLTVTKDEIVEHTGSYVPIKTWAEVAKEIRNQRRQALMARNTEDSAVGA